MELPYDFNSSTLDIAASSAGYFVLESYYNGPGKPEYIYMLGGYQIPYHDGEDCGAGPIAAFGDEAYALSYTESDGSRLNIFPSGNSVSASGNFLRVFDGYAYLLSDGSVQIVDVSPASQTKVMGSVSISDFYAIDMTVLGKLGFVIDKNKMCIIDLSDPVNPAIIKTIDFAYDATGVCVSGDYVYVSSEGLRIFQL
jgi:hypothetical protein